MYGLTVIQSKLIPPIPQDSYMRRSSFNKKLNEALSRQVTLVHSGPGYGKSLGLAQYFRDHHHLYSWYTVTEEDDDIIPFITYLKASIERVIPDFGKQIDDMIKPSGFVSDDEIQQWLALFINELCKIKKPFVIIIDDFHLVDYVFQINIFMERLIELLPPHIKLIISSRNRPKWSNLLKLKLNNLLYELTKEDFIFTKEEIIVYLEDYFQIMLDEEQIDHIYEVTEGWAIAINLLALQWMERESFDHMINPAFQNIYDYLSEEVFKRRTKEEQDWLLAFAIFPTFSVQLVENFYGKEAVEQLIKIADEHAFIQSLGDHDTFRYHALFEQFLKNKWLEVDPIKYAELNKRATQYYLKEKNDFQATYHAMLTNDQTFLAEILTKTASSIIRSGQFDWFLEVYQQLDESVCDVYYSLYYYIGEVHRYRAFYEQSRRAYKRCLELAENNKDSYYMSLSNAGIAHIYLDTIQPALAETYLIKAIHYSQITEKMPEKERALLKRQFAENLVNLGRAKDAKEWVKNEKLDKNILREGNLDARIMLRMGKLYEAESILLDHTDKKVAIPDSHREVKVILSLIYTLIGEIDRAIYLADQGIQIGQDMKSRFVEAVGYIRKGHAEIFAYPYEIERAEKSYMKAIELMDQLNVSRGKAEALMGLMIVKARKGLYEEAIRYGNYALRDTNKVNDNWMSGLIHNTFGIILYYKNDLVKSEEHLLQALKLFRASGDLYNEMISYFWLMNVYYKNGNKERLKDMAIQFANICVNENYEFFITKDTLFGLYDRYQIYPLFHEIKKINHPNINQLTKIIKLDEFKSHPGYQLFIKIFGRIRVTVGHNYGNELVWQREKAKELFLYLVFHRNRFIPKEELMQVLWEDTDEKTADRNFKVTLNALLKALEPNRKAREPSFFIIRKEKMYQLNPDATIVDEREIFLEASNKGLETIDVDQSIDHLLMAHHLFKDTPFGDMRDVDWLSQERQKLEQKHIQVLEKLAQLYLKKSDFLNTIKYSEMILKYDVTWEEAYRLLMLAYYRLQNRPQSIKWYNRCVEVLQKELNINPMQATVDLYEMILNYDLP